MIEIMSPLCGECSNPLPCPFKIEIGLTSYYFLAESKFYFVFKPDTDTFLQKVFLIYYFHLYYWYLRDEFFKIQRT